MVKATLLILVTIAACFSALKNCTACTDGNKENVKGVLGRSVTFSCRTTLLVCDNFHWQNKTLEIVSYLPDSAQGRANITTLDEGLSVHISEISIYDPGSYECWCYINREAISMICNVNVTPICQSKMLYDGAETLYNSSLSNSHDVSVAKGQHIKIACPEGADSNTNCYNVVQKGSGEFTYSFKVRRRHNSCRVECQVRRNEEVICSVNFILSVSTIETSEKPLNISTTVSTTVLTTVSPTATTTVSPTDSTTSAQPGTTNTSTTISAGTHAHTNTKINSVQKKKQDTSVTDTPGSFPVLIPVGILVFILVGVSFALCFYIFSSRSKSNSRSNKKIKRVNSSSDDNIPIGPTYATVDKSSDRCEKGKGDSMKQEVPCTDGFYSEINDSRNVTSTTQQANSARTETSITYEHYSEVDISNAELDSKEDGAKNDSDLYSEVQKKQPPQKESSQAISGPSVPSGQTDQVVEQRNSYPNQTVDDTSTTQVLYAVVDKKKK